MARITKFRAGEVFEAISKSLVDFGYSGVTPMMIQDTHEAMRDGKRLPHGIVGMFAKKQIDEAIEKGLLPSIGGDDV